MSVGKTTVHDVAIIGGGLVGSSLALALSAVGLDVALVEPLALQTSADVDAWDTRIYAISPGNAAFLEQLNVWQRLDMKRVQRVEAMEIYGDEPAGQLNLNAYDAGLRELAFIVEAGALQRAMLQAMSGIEEVHVFSPARATEMTVSEARARVTLADETVLEAKLVVGTDGGDSWVRKAAEIASRTSEYRQLGVVANFETEQSHRGLAFQWFRPDGVLALLPLPGNRTSMVWSTSVDKAEALLAMEAGALAEMVTDASRRALGNLRGISPAAGFPLRLTQVTRLIAPRVALAGDAAHSVHPLAGQGVNLGMRDVRQLAMVLGERLPRQDCGDWALLRRYERARREDIAAIEFSTDSLQKLFGNSSVWVSAARNFGLSAVNQLAPLKKLLIHHAAG